MPKKGKKMSAALKSFLKREGRFPRKGELARTGGSKARGSRGRGHRTTTTARRSGTSSSGPARVGRIYQGASTGFAVLAPVTDDVIASVYERQMPTVEDLLSIKNKVLSVPYAENLAIEAATAVVDKKMGQAAAISRGSITALLPEAFLGLKTGEEGRRHGAREAHTRWSQTRNGYEPEFNGSNYGPDFLTYRALKHGGQVVRKLRTRSAARGGLISRLLDPVGEYILRPVGLTW